MNWIDGHLDLAYLQLTGRNLSAPCPASQGCISLPDLREGHVNFIFGTIFTEPDPEDPSEPCGYASDDPDEAHDVGIIQLECYERLAKAGEIRIVRNRKDLNSHDTTGSVIKLLLLMEGADPIRTPDEVPFWFERGLRMVGMAWWKGTRYAGGNGNHGPLTSMGVELITALDTRGIIHDASHLADESFDGLLEHAKGPIVATHSNCRVLMGGDDQRHLRDDQIKAIGDRGGVVGLNLFSNFLIPVTGKRASIADCVGHIQRVCEIMGHRKGVALGSDADGGFVPEKLPIDLDHPRKYGKLADALRNEGWSDDDLAGFMHGNWMRLLSDALPN